MTREYEELVQEVSTSTGTGAFTVTGVAPSGRRPFSVHSIGATFEYEAFAGSDWELGVGTRTDATHIARNPVKSSNGGALVNFTTAPTVVATVIGSTLGGGLTNPNDPGFDIIVLLGQSNMVGQDSPTPALDISHPNVFSYGCYPTETATYRKITQAVDPLRFNYTQTSLPTAGNGAGLSMGSWLSKTYAGMIPSNRKVLLVPAARSATRIFAQAQEWFPGDGTNGGNFLYENAITQANMALAEAKLMYPNSRVVGFAWHQGEGDADWTVNQLNYAGCLKTLIYGMRNRITGAANAWFVIGGLMAENVANVRNNTPGYAAIDAAHRQVAVEFPRVAYTPGLTGYGNTDNLHYTAAGARILGCNLASIIPIAAASRGADTTAPTVRTLTVTAAAPSVLAMALHEPLDPAYVPAASDFTITGHTVSGVSVVGNTVYLAVTAPFVSGESARTVTYTPNATTALRDVFGNKMSAYGPGNITNNAPAVDSTPPTFSAPTVANATPSTLTLTASETLNTAITPDVSAFSVSGHTVLSVTVNANSVTLGLGQSFVNGEAASTVTYAAPASNGLRDTSNNQAVSFGPLAVTNNVQAAQATDTIAPTVSGAQVANASPTVIQVTMSETLAASTPATSAFTVSGSKTVSSVSISGAVASITVSSAYAYGDVITVSYAQPGANPRLQDAAGNATVNFGPISVTNNVAAPVSNTSTDLRFDSLVNMTETSAVAPYAYQTVGYSNHNTNPNGGVSQLGLAGDGTFIVKLGISGGSPNTTQNMVGFSTTRTVGNYNNNAFNIRAGSNYGMYVGSGTLNISNRVPANGDLVKLVRAGTTVQAYISSDDGTTWANVITFTAVPTGTLYARILAQTNGSYTAPNGTGWA